MSNTNVENIVNGFLASYGTTVDANANNHIKGPQSKNIAISEWNDIVHLLGVRSEDVKRLYNAFENIKDVLGKAELADAAVERIDSYLNNPESSSNISLDYLSKTTSTEQTVRSNVIIDPSKKLSAGTVSANKVEGTSADFTSEVKAGSVSTSGNVSSSGVVSGASGVFGNLSASTSFTVNANAAITGDLTVNGTAHANNISAAEGAVEGNFTVLGNLYVSGTTVEVGRESLTVKDNVIVVNAGGSADIPSGVVMSTGVVNDDGTINAYALLYKKSGASGEAVYVGKGVLTYVETDDGPAAEFAYAPGEAVALAARIGEWENKSIPIWDSSKHAFVSSKLNVHELRDISEYDYEITDPSQFTQSNLNKMSGNVLVNCDIMLTGSQSYPEQFTIPSAIKVLNFNGHKLDVDLTAGNGTERTDCRLIGAHFAKGDNWEAGYEQHVSNFGSIEFCRGAGVYWNCGRIAHSDIWRAVSCDFITDVQTFPYEYEDTVFSNCRNITNVRVSDIYNVSGGVEFDGCSYISNVSFVGDRDGVVHYNECTYVDVLTCYGYRYRYYDDDLGDVEGPSYGVPYIDANGITTFLESAEGGSYGT